MADMEKKDIHNRIQAYRNALNRLEHDTTMIKENKVLILKFIRDCRLGKTLKRRQKKTIGEARCLKYIHILKKISFWLDKPFDQVTQEDMENFVESLENDKYLGKITGKNGKIIRVKKLSHSTKTDYKKTIRKFYKWLLGNNDHFPELVDWIDTYDVEKEIPALRREEAEKLVDASNIRDKAIIMFLFDSGARAEEFLNIRIGDLTKAEDIYKVRIAFSKTKPRTIHLPICSRYLELWLQEFKGKDEGEFLFPLTYDGLRMMLYRVGKRRLDKRVTPHVLRHSSATYYANLLKSPYKLCYRYGWSMASDMPNRYIDREGIIEEETPDIVRNHDFSRLEKQNRTLQEELSMIKESNSDLHNQIEEIRSELHRLHEGKDFMKVFLSLVKSQRDKSKAFDQTTDNKFDIVIPTQGLKSTR